MQGLIGRRMWLVALVGSVVLSVAAAPQAQAGEPLRSGAVAGGPIDTGPSGGFTTCQVAPDCRVWLTSGCDERLAGQGVGVQSSIIDVRSLAGRRTLRRFVVLDGAKEGLPGLVIGGFKLQFWSARCSEINASSPPLDSSAPAYREYVRSESSFRIPAQAAWLTAVADDNVLIRWELY